MLCRVTLIVALPPILTSLRIISSQVSPEILHFPLILDGRMEQLKSPWPQYSFDFIQILDIWSLTPPNEDSSFPPGDQLVTTWCPKWDHIVNYQCHFKLYNINNLFKIQTTDRIIPMPSAQYWLFWRTRVKTHVRRFIGLFQLNNNTAVITKLYRSKSFSYPSILLLLLFLCLRFLLKSFPQLLKPVDMPYIWYVPYQNLP